VLADPYEGRRPDGSEALDNRSSSTGMNSSDEAPKLTTPKIEGLKDRKPNG
jgi:hypothetical protein